MKKKQAPAVARVLDEQTWRDVAGELLGAGSDWWSDHRDALIGMAKDEAEAVFARLRRGDTVGAKFELGKRMTDDQWRAYRDGTTQALAAEANKRARLYAALDNLSTRVARVLGAAVLHVLGL